MDTGFRVGQLVQLRANPTRSGAVTEVLPPAGGKPRYLVFHAPGDVGEYHEEQLVAADTPRPSTTLGEAIAVGAGVEADVFRAQLAASRLAYPLVDNLYSLQAARIHHIPFQFKPLLRFLRADRPRLLIADEVGVGKTIEAGLILKELQARQDTGNVLVVCPKALVTKWRSEMRRFDEDFRPLTGETLRYCLSETHLDGAWPPQYSRAIIHLELLRQDDHLRGVGGRRPRPGLLTLDPPPSFSVTIIDEAHHLRNPETKSHELARFLCDVSEAVLFLSATPLHLGSANLYALLNLLRPDLFPDQSVFEEMIEPNRHITTAMRHVRSRAPELSWQADAGRALLAACQTSWGERVLADDPRCGDWRLRLHSEDTLSDVERVRCVRDLEELHSLAHIMNRTRRRDIGRFTTREPHTVSVPFLPQQDQFYRALVEFRLDMLSLDFDPRVARLVTDILERQAASCLPALVPTLERFIRTGRFSGGELYDAVEDEEPEVDLPPSLLRWAQTLRSLAKELPSEDPKFDRLTEVVERTMAEGGPRKVLLFSYFLHTLTYLERRLRDAGYRVGLVSGRVDEEEREHLRERFRLASDRDDALDVLLSSEVGCEGLDYEFCDRLVNYDIPWNPMRIEQRIGRIDRFGQTAEKVLIFNFVTPGTVEERIFFRCFERLGIFRDTVGDLEEVLGDTVQDLTRVALDPSLSPAQAEAKAAQVADNVLRLADEHRRLEEEGETLLGLDQAFAQDVDTLVAEERFVPPDDLCLMITKFLELPAFGGRLTPDERGLGFHRLRLPRDGRQAMFEQVRALGRRDRPTVEFTRWLGGTEPHLLLTFSQETALQQRDTPFVTPLHPLSRCAINYWTSLRDPLVSFLAVSDESVPAGRYLFVAELWEALALRKELRLVGFAWDLDGCRPAPEVASALLRLLSHARTSERWVSLPSQAVKDGLRELDEEAHSSRLEALRELHERNGVLLARKLASLDAYYRNRLERVESDLAKATESRIVRMREAERERIRRDYQAKRRDVEDRREADIISRRIAAGILTIEWEGSNGQRLPEDR